MVEKVIWQAKAKSSLKAIVDYLNETFSPDVSEDFIDSVEIKINRICAQPKMGQQTDAVRNIYKTVLHRRTVIYYRYRPRKKQIELLVFWQTRQNPRRLKY
jgi:plasmid stabilization system protein ParE